MKETSTTGNAAWHENPRVINSVVFLLGLLFLALYAFLSTKESGLNILGQIAISPAFTKIAAVFLKEVGLAGVVAVIINISIEGFNRRRHEKEKTDLVGLINQSHADNRDAQIKAINQKMFQTVYERNIPTEVFREVEEQLLRSNFVRTDSSYELAIRKVDDSSARLSIRHSYGVRNLSSIPATYTLKLGIDVLRDKCDSYAINSVSIGKKKFDSANLPIHKSKKSESHEWWQFEVQEEVQPDQIVQCIVDFTRLSPLAGKEVICCLTPTQRMSVRFYDAEEKFAVRGMSLHPRDEINHSPDDAGDRYHWALDGAILPGQGFLIDWTPRATA